MAAPGWVTQHPDRNGPSEVGAFSGRAGRQRLNQRHIHASDEMHRLESRKARSEGCRPEF